VEVILKLATDIGGTFTDLVILNEATGEIGTTKASSTPPNFAQGILTTIIKSGIDPHVVEHFVHGTTVVINALTERKSATTALVTTKGFRDVLAVGRANRPDIYNLRFRKQSVFVPREHRLEVEERLDFHGRVVTPLNEKDVERVALELESTGLEAVAICFLHSYINPAHEQQCAEILRHRLPGVFVSISSDITKEWREYERSSTVVLNSYVQPVASSYLANLETALREMGIGSGLHVMKSNGGTNTFELSKAQPIHMVESGPVGGVIGAKVIGEAIGQGNLITIDVGGTTAKTSLIDGGVVKFTTEYRIEKDSYSAGYPIKIPVVDIVEIGAGGGSIAWVDEAKTLKIGPKSAGAVPGPACYGKGGEDPTITDANLILNRINPDYFLGGEMQVEVDLSREAYQGIADHYGVSIEEAALGAIRLADANMVNAIKLVSVRRGYDPRDFSLVAFGGGGSMHAAALARELQISNVIIPVTPGTFSALGMMMTEPMQDFIRTRIMQNSSANLAEAKAVFDDMIAEARAFLVEGRYQADRITFQLFLDMRYLGQEHTVRVPVLDIDSDKLAERFHELHEHAYTFRLDSPTEFVNFHVTGVVSQDPVDLTRYAPPSGSEVDPKDRRKVYFEGAWYTTTVFERSKLPQGVPVQGPCIIEEPDATTVVHPGMSASLDSMGNIVIETGV
jgi:N-methylhydantoinase A